MLASLLKLAGLDRAVPDYTTLCRRQKTLAVQIPHRRADGPLNLRLTAPASSFLAMANGRRASMAHIADATRQMVNEKIKAMANKPTTASCLLRALGAIYGTQLAYRDDGYEHDPTYRLKGYEARTRELLFDEAKRWPAMEAISKVPNMTRRAAWLALLFTGFRMCNIRALRWQDIDFDEKMLTLGRMKNGLRRTFPLSDAALDVFRLTPRTHDQIVFEGRHYNKPITGLRQIDIDGNDVDNSGVLRPHDTRHLFSSAAAKAGLSGPVINWMRGDVTIMQGAAGRYMHDLGSHADANAIANQIVSKSAPTLSVEDMLRRA